MKIKYYLLLSLFCLCAFSAHAAGDNYELLSPNGRIKVLISTTGTLSYRVKCADKDILAPSSIGIELGNKMNWGIRPLVVKASRNHINKMVKAQFYRFDEFKDECNELNLSMKDGYGVVFRAYDEGVAYRFYTSQKKPLVVKNELAEFNFPEDYTAYLPYTTNEKKPFAMAFQNIYDVVPLSKAKQLPAFLPVSVDCGDGVKATLLESDLENYPGMFVEASKAKLKGVFAPYPKTTDYYPWRKQLYVTSGEDYIAKINGSRSLPWRIIAITEKDIQMPVNNMVYALASPSRIGDTSWIRPGQVSWDWWNDWGLRGVDFKAGINQQTYKYYIDFASLHHIPYIILDEGWYNPKSGDMLTAIPELNLPELVAYGKKKGVDIILWTVFNVLDEQLEAACSKYEAMGIKGFKVDFLDRDDETAVQMAYRIAEVAARHHLMLDYHGFYKPTGLNRTYPNVVNIESVFGMEEMKWNNDKKDMPLYDVTFPYIRMMAGSVDYTPGAMHNASKADYQPIYYNPMSMGTRCHQLACYIVHDSPLTMLADAPTNYEKEPECTDFITSIPTRTDETKILQGELGKYIVTARRYGNDWYIGGLTDWNPRDIQLDLSFLNKEGSYVATLMTDGVNANKQAEDYHRDTQIFTSASHLDLHLASGGGFAICLKYREPLKVVSVPKDKNLSPFYKKYVATDGLYVISSPKVRDEALLKACDIMELMLSKRPDIKQYMVSKGCHFIVIGEKEQVCDIPEYAAICNSPDSIKYWNWRARGFGGAPESYDSSSCGEENLLALPGDRYEGENIMIHEFAHLIHQVGIVGVEPDFNTRLTAVMNHAKAKGLWAGTYALTDKEEYFAECVQSFFNCNRYSKPANGVHNDINRRSKLRDYDPEMYRLLCNYFNEIDIPICNKIHE